MILVQVGAFDFVRKYRASNFGPFLKGHIYLELHRYAHKTIILWSFTLAEELKKIKILNRSTFLVP